MSGNPLGSQQSITFGHQNKCQENFRALKKHEFWAPKTKVRKLAGLSKSMSFWTKKQMSGNPPGSLKQYMNFGHQNKCQETFWALQKHEFCTPTTNVRKLAGISKTCVLGAKNKCQETRLLCTKSKCRCCQKKHMSLGHQKHMSRKPLGSQKSMRFEHQNKCQEPSGLSKNMSFAHQQQMSGNSLGSQTKNMCFGRQNKCQEIRRALKQPVQEFCAPKANVGAVKKTHESWAPKTNVRKPIGLSTKHHIWGPKQMSGNLLALKKHEFWAPKTKVRKLAGLSKSMSFWTKKQMSGNPPGSLKQYMNLGHQNKCQETFWALQKHEFCTPTTNVRKISGISKTCVLGAKNKCQETRRALTQPVQEFCAPKGNVGAVKKNTWVLGTKHKCQENHWALKKAWVLGFQNKCQEIFWALQNYVFWALRKLAEL